MTIEELGREFVYKPTYLKKHWTRVKEYWEPKGIVLIKEGRGDSAKYGIKLWNEDNIRWETTGKVLDLETIANKKELKEWNTAQDKLYSNW